MKLHEITGEVLQALDALEAALEWQPDTDAEGNPIDGDGNIIENIEAYRAELAAAWSDTLESSVLEFEDKAGNLAAAIKSIKKEVEALKDEEKALAERRRAKERMLERLKEYLLGQMEQSGIKKIDHVFARISVRTNPESVHISDEDAAVKWLKDKHDECLKYLPPEIRKTAVKELINGGETVPGAEVIRTQSLVVK